MENENRSPDRAGVPVRVRYRGRHPFLDQWRQQAACNGQTDLFFSRQTTSKALDVCALCPVIWPCGQYALRFDDRDLNGIWGGMSTRQRRWIRYLRARGLNEPR